ATGPWPPAHSGNDQTHFSGFAGSRGSLVSTRHRRACRLRRRQDPHIRDAGERDGPGPWGRTGAPFCPVPVPAAITVPAQGAAPAVGAVPAVGTAITALAAFAAVCRPAVSGAGRCRTHAGSGPPR